MHPTVLAYTLTCLAIPLVRGATWNIVDTYAGQGFLTGWDHQAIADPTHGRVNYTDQVTALAKNLTFVNSNTLIMRADFTTTLSSSGPGRNSVRLRTKKTYTNHLAVFDIRHMPQGCGTWPAVWEVREDGWSVYGEVDIIKGVNGQGANLASPHTTSGCMMPSGLKMTGTQTQQNCDVSATSNSRCGVRFSAANSYGPAFNQARGGWYVYQRTSAGLKVWFWSRTVAAATGKPPAAVVNGASNVDTSTFGTPAVFFPNTQCDLSSKLTAHNIIINLTLCGDWAGAVYGQSGCSGSCVDYVNNNPAAFTNAYWDIAAVRVYQ